MKSKRIFKTIFTLLSIFFLVFASYYLIKYLKNFIDFLSNTPIDSASYKPWLDSFLNGLVYYTITFIFSILFFLLVNFKGLKFLTNSLIEQIKEHREKTAEERKEKKKAKLEKQLAELEEMKNE